MRNVNVCDNGNLNDIVQGQKSLCATVAFENDAPKKNNEKGKVNFIFKN